MIDPVELPPLTTDQRQAIRDCDFSYVNALHNQVWLIFKDEGIIKRLGEVARRSTTYTRDSVTKSIEHEALIGHPEAILLVMQIQNERSKNRESSSSD